MDPSPAPPIPSYRRRLRVILTAAILVPAAIIAVFWFGMSPVVPSAPIRLVRSEDGKMLPVDPPQPHLFSFEVQAGATKSVNNFNSCSTSSRSNPSYFACSRLVILNHSEHVLMARVGPLLLDEFKKLDYVRQIDYYPLGFGPEQGELAPDVTIVLDLAGLTESNWPALHTVEATVTITAGNGPPGCSNSYTDHLTPPVVQFDWNGTLTHRSTTTGPTSSAAKYKHAAQDIAHQIGESLTKEFAQRREKEGVMPDLPEVFTPAYRKPPALPFGDLGALELVSSWHGLMSHNETLWRLTSDRPAAEVLGEARRRLEPLGWKTLGSGETPGQDYLRMGRDSALLLVYVPRPREMPEKPSPESSAVHIQYLDRMTQEEVRAAVDQAMASGASTDVLICFERHWSDDQSRRILKSFESRPNRTPQAALTLASLYRRLKQDDNARRELSRACVLLRTIGPSSDLEGRARELAKQLGNEKLADTPLEPKILAELGFIELKPGVQVPPREIGFEEPVHFHGKASGGSLKIISLRAVRKTTASNDSHGLAHVDSQEGMRSWGSGGNTYCASMADGQVATFTLERQGTSDRFRLSTQLSGK